MVGGAADWIAVVRRREMRLLVAANPVLAYSKFSDTPARRELKQLTRMRYQQVKAVMNTSHITTHDTIMFAKTTGVNAGCAG